MPNTVTQVRILNNGNPIFNENSINLTHVELTAPSTNATLKQEFFDSLVNAPNLRNLTLGYMNYWDFRSLSDYLKDELPSVTFLYIYGATSSSVNILEDLEGIEKFTGLQSLKVNYTSANLDISAIRDCSTLTSVDLRYCNIQSLSGIEGLTNLQSLTLNNNNITGVKELENLTNLTGLNLENNLISDTSTYVNEAGETVTYNNLEILANLNSNRNGKLTTLLLSGNDNIIDFSPVSTLTWSNKSGF